MFKFVPGARRAWWPVAWKAADEAGNIVENKIEMRFILMDDAAYQTLITETGPGFDKAAEGLTGAEREAAQRTGRAGFVQQFAEDWRGIMDEGGAPLPWSADNLGMVIQLPGVMQAVLAAHAAARAGARPNG